MHLLANSWTPDQWIAVISAITTSVAAMVAAIIAATKSGAVHLQNQDIQREIKPPSNGITLGTVVERIDQVLHALAEAHLDGTLNLPDTPQVSSTIPNPNPGLTPPQQDRADMPGTAR